MEESTQVKKAAVRTVSNNHTMLKTIQPLLWQMVSSGDSRDDKGVCMKGVAASKQPETE